MSDITVSLGAMLTIFSFIENKREAVLSWNLLNKKVYS